jgi:hypothetical protein
MGRLPDTFACENIDKSDSSSRLFLAQDSNQRGQALLIVLLVLSVALTVVLSIASKSVTEITVTEYQENSARALSAAEAGVEESIISGTSSVGTVTLSNNATYQTTVTYQDSAAGEFVYPDGLKSGESVTFWFASHNTSTGLLTCSDGKCFLGDQLQICWGDALAPKSAIELSFYYDPFGNWQPGTDDFSGVKVKRLAYDSDSTRSPSTNFTTAGGSCTVSGQSFLYSTNVIDLSNTFAPDCNPTTTDYCMLMARVRIFYNNNIPQKIAIRTPSSSRGLPAQGAVIDSTGEFNDSTRRVRVFRSFITPQDVFDSAVFSYGGIVK